MQATTIPVRATDHAQILVNFLADKLRLSRRKAKSLLDDRRVFVNQRRVWMAHHRLKPGDRVEVHTVALAPPMTRAAILYRDDEYVIANKPAGCVSNGKDSLESRLREMLQQPELVAVHRLDRETSGCNLFALSVRGRDAMIPRFEQREVTKVYHAIVAGRLVQRKIDIQIPMDGLPALTHIDVLDANSLASHIKARPETGRTHQIRKHMAAIKFPIVGDKSYASGSAVPEPLRRISRQMLHASSLIFTHPSSGQTVRAHAPLPSDFRAGLKALKLT